MGDFSTVVQMREPKSGDTARGWTRTLRRYQWTLLLFGVSGALAAVLGGVRVLPLYRSQATLEVRPTAGEAGRGSEATDGDSNLQTQMRLLQSESLLNDAVNRAEAQPRPASVERSDLLGWARRWVGRDADGWIPYRTAVADAARRVEVRRLEGTRLVEVRCEAWSAELAARFCNGLAAAALARELEAAGPGASLAGAAGMEEQLNFVRQRMVETQARLTAASDGRDTAGGKIAEGRLRALKDELARAKADRVSRQTAARSQIARTGKLFAATGRADAERRESQLEAARHREELLNITYHAELAKVSADQQRTAKIDLLRSELDSEQQLYQSILRRESDPNARTKPLPATLRVVDPAHAMAAAVSPRRGLAAGLGMGAGVLLGMAFAFLRERLLNVFSRPGDVQGLLHVPELGTIPELAPVTVAQVRRISATTLGVGDVHPEMLHGRTDTAALAHWTDEFSFAAEAFRNVAELLVSTGVRRGLRSLVVASPGSHDGRTTVAANLGVAMSRARLRVVLVDGDLRRPGLHKAFGIEDGPGLSDVLRGEIDPRTAPLAAFSVRSQVPNLSVIRAGQAGVDPLALLHSPRMEELLQRLAESFDVVLIDTPPALRGPDARILARAADGAVLVFRASATTLDAAAMARDLFEREGVQVAGTILNDFNPRREGWSSYYRDVYREQHGETPRAA